MAQNTTSACQKKIVVLGGSYSGLSTAHYLLRHACPSATRQRFVSGRHHKYRFTSHVPTCLSSCSDIRLLASEKAKEGHNSLVGEDRMFKEDTRETQMVPIGKSKGVGAVIGYVLPSFMVWAIKGRDYWLWTTGGLWSGKQWAKES